MSVYKSVFVLMGCLASFQQCWAKETLALQRVATDIYAIVGETGQRTKENLGNNSTFGFVVTRGGVVLIDSGGTYDGAKAIDAVIRTVTDKPIVKVINTGGQDHRWLGNGYFKEKAAEIIASKTAVKDQQARLKDQMYMLGNLVGEQEVKSTSPVYADKIFDNQYKFKLGDTDFEIYFSGQAHTPGDSYVWLPQQGVMFTGDIVFTERMLGVLDYSNSKSWVNVFETMAKFKSIYLVPGHGHVTNLDRAKKDTYDYLIYLRKTVADFMDAGRDISEIGKLDQSKFRYLLNSDTLSGRNAQKVYTELEWE